MRKHPVLWACVVYLICCAVFFHPHLDSLTTALVGLAGDNMQDFWNTWYSQMMWDRDTRHFFTTHLLFYPEGTSLTYHSFAYSNLILIFLERKIFQIGTSQNTLVLLHNTATILSFYLGSIGVFLLVRRYTQSVVSALVGGFIFGFSPFHLAHLCQMHVVTIQYIPFFVWSFLNYVDTRRWRWGIAAVAFYVLSALSSWYYIVYVGYFILFYYLYHAIRQRSFLWRSLLLPSVGVILGAGALLSPLILSMMTQGGNNTGIYLGGHNDFVADLLGFFVFHPDHILGAYTNHFTAAMSGNITENTVYLGVVNILLIAWAMIWGRREDTMPTLRYCLWGMLVFALFACGSYLHVMGKETPIPLPTLVTTYIPFLKNIRTPSRAVVLVYLFLSIASAVSLGALIEKVRVKRLGAITLVVVLLIVVDFYPVHAEKTPIYAPPGYEVMEKDGDYGILDLPLGYEPSNYYMMFQTFHRRPIVGGVISRKLNSTLADDLETVDIEFQKDQLIQNGVKYVVIHRDLVGKRSKRVIDIEKYLSTYTEVFSDPITIFLKVY